MSGRPGEAAQRLFFALWPDEEARRALSHATAAAVRHCGGRPVPAASLHVTLAFIGSVAQGRIGELRQLALELAAARSPAGALSLRFDHLAHWPRSQILCAVAVGDTSAVRSLAAALTDRTTSAGFTPDLKLFREHVTLARKVTKPPADPAIRPVQWRFQSFVLLDSRTDSKGPVYSVIESYSLVAAEKPHE